MQKEVSSPHSQEPAPFPYPDPDQSSPCTFLLVEEFRPMARQH